MEREVDTTHVELGRVVTEPFFLPVSVLWTTYDRREADMPARTMKP